MNKNETVTHLVITVNNQTGQIAFDGDGTREWIRELFDPKTTTYDLDACEWVAVDGSVEQAALDKLMEIGILVDGIDYNNWMER
jgi:hypothetical protein